VTIGRNRHVLDAFFDALPPAGRPWLAGVMLVLFIGPWLVPGWALAGSQVLMEGLARQGFMDPASAPRATYLLTVGSILGCGLMLVLPARVFEQAVKPFQSVLMILIVIFAVALAAIVFTADGVRACATGFAGGLPWSAIAADPALLIAGFVFAGLGGSLNLGYSDYLREAGYTGGNAVRKFPVSCWEHFVLFGLGNALTIVLLALIAVMSFSAVGYDPATDFLAEWTARVKAAAGTASGPVTLMFIVLVYLIFITSELGIIDVVSRLVARLAEPLGGKGTVTRVRAVIGLVLILLVTYHLWPKPPLRYLTFSGWGNTAAMFLYSFLLLFQFRRLKAELRPSKVVVAATAGCALVFLALFVSLIALKLRA